MNVRLKYDMPFTAGVYYNGALRMNNYNLRLWMTTNTEHAADHSISFERIKYFIYTQMDSTIFINAELMEQCDLFYQAGASITTLPGDPVDQLIGIMLYYKLNAIVENRMSIIETELGSTFGDNMVYLHSEHETTSGFVQPTWWTAADLIHSDFDDRDSDKIVAIPQATPWRDLDLAWPDEHTGDNSGNVVVFANFKTEDETE